MRPIDRLRAKKKNKTPSLKEVFTELLTVLVGFVGGVISIALGIAIIFLFWKFIKWYWSWYWSLSLIWKIILGIFKFPALLLLPIAFIGAIGD